MFRDCMSAELLVAAGWKDVDAFTHIGAASCIHGEVLNTTGVRCDVTILHDAVCAHSRDNKLEV